MSNKSRCARRSDLKAGRTLFYVDGEKVTAVKLLTVKQYPPSGFTVNQSIRFTYHMSPTWLTDSFAGDMGIRGCQYDHRPCMFYTSRGAAERAIPLIQAWNEETRRWNEAYDRWGPEE